ncbi:hypothetical protein I6A84_01170 [Frankia sp. CNm7]|uniref:Deoxyribonuclease NucA/NucB domain-containing protein n=1 Tax=Frankia nepalensis TaxID=1836974 RepID=A0A937REU4_9ACTN|nr:hypothetical protein [Frankia nepalensis]MBL7508929.1 hypothetical protein [Frankia nepalensis]MBL7516769.1 hypothetical protein [Frankia nepalensis]MBL7628707.1 hypothetical protein [Frankia nepalensis]
MCVEVGPPDSKARDQGRAGQVTPSSLIPPGWCADHQDGNWWALRWQGCRTTSATLVTRRTVDGATVITGEVSIRVLEFVYGDPNQTAMFYQIMVVPYAGWGDALAATITGTASTVSGCTLAAQSFPSQPLSPLNGQFRIGESSLNSTATAAGAVANCTARWNMVATVAGYPPASSPIYQQNQFRCDNAFAGRSAGCVIPWVAEEMDFNSTTTPEIASHIFQAQVSGLPGATNTTPLHRSTDTAKNDRAYNRACYQSPAVTDRSCDEYPFKSANEGLGDDPDWLNHRRTFDYCWFGLPRQTGSIGASVCMVLNTEQNIQGGTISTFYQDWRVMNGDPFWVHVNL